MYESTINIDILKGNGLEPLAFLNTPALWETTTITGTVSGVINLNSVWINNTISDRVVSVVKAATEIQELTEIWVSLLQEKAESEGFTIYISIAEE